MKCEQLSSKPHPPTSYSRRLQTLTLHRPLTWRMRWNYHSEIGRDREVDIQSSIALHVKAQHETLLTLSQISFLALDNGNSGKLVTLSGNEFWQIVLVFKCTGRATNIRKTIAWYPDGLAWTLFPLVFFMLNSTCLPIQGNATYPTCEVSWWSCPTVRHWPGLLVGGEPSLQRTSGGGLTEVQTNLEWQGTTILFEPEKGWISVLKHLI